MAKRIECFYGQSLTGKSEGIVEAIKMMYEGEGLASRVIVGDGSRATYEVFYSAVGNREFKIVGNISVTWE